MRYGRSCRIPSMTSGGIVPAHWSLDIALGIGGLPRSRVVEIYGPGHQAKQPSAWRCGRRDSKWRSRRDTSTQRTRWIQFTRPHLRVNVPDMLISQPDAQRTSAGSTDMLVRSGGVDIVVIDSGRGAGAKAEIEGEMGDPSYPACRRVS